MSLFITTIGIQAPPDRVWAVVCDVERWPEWTSSVTNLQRLDPGPLAVGSRARILQPKLRPAVWQVTELDEARKSFVWVSRNPGVRVTAWHLVETDGAGSKATLSLEFSGLLGPLIGCLYRRLNEQYLATEAKGLKQRCEA